MQPEMVFVGGTIRTLDHSTPVTDALAVSNGRVVALGHDAIEMRGTATHVVDLAGGVLLPSFGDGHAHPLLSGLGLRTVPVRGLRSVAEVVDAVRRWAEEHPQADWIVGDSFDPTIAPSGLFDSQWLDEAVPGRPVVLVTTDHHAMWVNSEALRRAGITRDTPEPADGEIVRRPDGSPLGTLREWGALDFVSRLLPTPGLGEQIEALEEATRLMASAGLTWAQDAWVAPDEVNAYLEAARQGRLKARVNLAFRAEPEIWRNQLDQFRSDAALVQSHEHDLVTARTIKFFSDGVIESGTAALIEPYHDCPHSHGIANWTQEDLSAAVTEVDRLGFQAHIHAIGDLGVRMGLDAVADCVRRNGPRDRRPTLAHVQLIDPDDLPRFAELGVVACLQPLWAQPDALMTKLTLPRIGSDRGSRQYQIGSLVSSGAHVSFGSDWPVSSYEPLRGIATAVARQRSDGEPPQGWLPQERVSVETALQAYSAGVAYQAFEEREWGTLVPGMRADLVHLAADPFTLSAAEIAEVPVLGTWLGGIRTH